MDTDAALELVRSTPAFLVSRGAARRGDFIGCTEEEVRAVSSAQGANLPRAYEEFLRTMGRAAGPLYSVDDAVIGLYPDVLELKQEAQEIAEGSGYQVPRGAVVVATYAESQFLFCLASEGDDPPVYRYMDGEPVATRGAGSYSDYLQTLVGEACRGWAGR